MQLELTDEEAGLLRELLDSALRELNYEIADTDTSRFRDELRARREQVRRLLDGVGGPLDDPPSA
jgi:hypothetical protein